LRRVLSSVRTKVGQVQAHLDPEHRRWIAHKREVDCAFDSAYGVDTGGITPIRELTVPAISRAAAVDHIAIDPSEFRSALALLPSAGAGFTFIDYGSGKGRALMLAAEAPFSKIIGVEHARELHEIAQRNVRASRRAHDIELVCMDAGAFAPPDDQPLVLYFYHPFGPDVLRRVVRAVRASWERSPRPIYVLYVNAFHRAVWQEEGFVPLREAGNAVLFAKPSS
jgi:hypothetical protein